jgi:hypothetical protein
MVNDGFWANATELRAVRNTARMVGFRIARHPRRQGHSVTMEKRFPNKLSTNGFAVLSRLSSASRGDPGNP